jgi:CRP-like cAMP-binding protein
MQSIFQNIYKHPLLPESDLQSIMHLHKQVNFNKGDIILRSGCIANEYYLLEMGLVRAFVINYNEDEITTGFFTDGEIIISPPSLFQRIPSQETLQAVTDCIAWKIVFDDFQQLYHNLPGFREWGRLWFSQQLFSLKQRSLDMITETATNRYLKLIKEKPQVIQNVPLKQIATYLGVTDTSLSRIRKDIVKTTGN